jgi:hypothetical protein
MRHGALRKANRTRRADAPVIGTFRPGPLFGVRPLDACATARQNGAAMGAPPFLVDAFTTLALTGHRASPRGGTVGARLCGGGRVVRIGRAVTVSRGELL